VLQILNPEGLWDAIYRWDTSELGSQNKMFYGTVEQNKYQLAAFLANIYVETLVAFLNEKPPRQLQPQLRIERAGVQRPRWLFRRQRHLRAGAVALRG
jgi:hypothetical protein